MAKLSDYSDRALKKTKNINEPVLNELKKADGCTSWYITLQLRRELGDKSLTRVDVSKNLQQLKKKKLVTNDGAHWKALAL